MITVRSFCEAFYKVLGDNAETARAALIVSQRVPAELMDVPLSWPEAAKHLVQIMISDDPIAGAVASENLALQCAFMTVPGTSMVTLDAETAAEHPIIAGWIGGDMIASVSKVFAGGRLQGGICAQRPIHRRCRGPQHRQARRAASSTIASRFLAEPLPKCGPLFGHAIESRLPTGNRQYDALAAHLGKPHC